MILYVLVLKVQNRTWFKEHSIVSYLSNAILLLREKNNYLKRKKRRKKALKYFGKNVGGWCCVFYIEDSKALPITLNPEHPKSLSTSARYTGVLRVSRVCFLHLLIQRRGRITT